MNLLKEKITNPAIITKLIPQRAPIIMVDSLLHYEPSKVISGFTITDSNIFVQNNIFTEPGLIEHMAQTVALYTGYHFYINNLQAPEGYIGAIKGVEITKLPKVKDQLETEVTILQEIMGVTLVSGTTYLNGEVIVTAQMKTVLKK
jgi:3-hydroxymyristoyl/3-hydroxydecanoyl-(acyl carrier protein) dehydratase